MTENETHALSRPDADGNRWTPCRTVRVYKYGRTGPKGSYTFVYFAENVRTGRSQMRETMSALRLVVDQYVTENATRD